MRVKAIAFPQPPRGRSTAIAAGPLYSIIWSENATGHGATAYPRAQKIRAASFDHFVGKSRIDRRSVEEFHRL
jgi:hypothetical protein